MTGRRALDPTDDKSELIRRALEPFGLKADDQQLWMAIAPRFYGIARDYKFLTQPGATPRIGEIEDQLFALEKAATAMSSALSEMGTAAFDWLFVFQTGEGTLSRRARAKGRGPRNRPGALDGMRCLFAREFDDYLEMHPWLRDANHPDHPWLQAGPKIDAAAKEVIRVGTKPKRGGHNQAPIEEPPESLRAWAILDAEQEHFSRALAPPNPYDITAAAAKRMAKVAQAARAARLDFKRQWPLRTGKDKGGPPQLSLGSAKWFVVESCGLAIRNFFGVEAFEKI